MSFQGSSRAWRLLFAAGAVCSCGEVGGSGGAGSGGSGAGGSGGFVSATGGASALGGAQGALAGGASALGGSGGLQPGAGGSQSGGGSASGGDASGSGGSEPRPTVVAAPGTTLVQVDPASLLQKFEGWGTSLCWWADRVGRWSDEGRGRVAELLLDEETGLGYNIFRYNIGGGENPSHDHMDQFKEIPGFETSDGVFHWDADPYQRAVLLDLVSRRDDLILEAFSNSPPYFMTKSSCASGATDGLDNLKDDSYAPFAHYLTEVVKHYRDSYGIAFRTLEPLNEPSPTWWKANGGQEGCHFSRTNQEKIIVEVKKQLAEKQLTETVVSAADENSMDDALTNTKAFEAETIAAIGQLNVHSYAGSKRRELRELSASLGLRLWQSESGPLSVDAADDIEAALFMAARIMTDLRDLGAEAWLDWQAADTSRNWASFQVNDEMESFVLLKRFYVQASYSRLIRPGAQLISVSGPDMVAALSPDGQQLSVLVWNGSSDEKAYTLDLTRLSSVGALGQTFVTSRQKDMESQAPVPIADYALVLRAPPQALTGLAIPLQ